MLHQKTGIDGCAGMTTDDCDDDDNDGDVDVDVDDNNHVWLASDDVSPSACCTQNASNWYLDYVCVRVMFEGQQVGMNMNFVESS